MDDEIIGDFLVESYEGLDRLESNFVILEGTPDDTATLTEVFRILHTIKGTCGFLGFGQLEKVAHRGENLLSLLRDSVLEMDEEITDALLATNDAIRRILEEIESTGEEGTHDNDELIVRLETLSGRADHAGDGDDSAADDGAAAADDSDATADETSAEAPADASADETPAADAPSAPEATDEATPPAEADAVAQAGKDDKERIGDILVDQGSADRTDVEIAATQQGMGDDRQIGNILVDDGRAQREEVEKAASKQRSAADSTIRVDVAVLDQLMNLVGELVLSRNQIIQLASSDDHQEFAAPAQRLNLITSELQEGVMKTRMQPIGNIWSKLPRVVRDLSQQFEKQIRLEMEGKDTELDRTILEAIKDP